MAAANITVFLTSDTRIQYTRLGFKRDNYRVDTQLKVLCTNAVAAGSPLIFSYLYSLDRVS